MSYCSHRCIAILEFYESKFYLDLEILDKPE